MEYRIITGAAIQCQDELNNLTLKYKLNILGISATNESTTILLELEEYKLETI